MSKPAVGQARLNVHIVLLGAAVAAYIGMIVLLPSTPNRTYQLSDFEIFILSATLVIPWIAAWVYGVTGYLHLAAYARSIKDEAAARPFRLLSRGIMVFVWSLIIATLISTFRSHHLTNPHIVVPTTIIDNYLYALAPLAGFYYIWRAIRQLGQDKIKLKQLDLTAGLAALALVALIVAYTVLIFTNSARQMSPGEAVPATYYLPDWLIVVSILLPAAISWVLGFIAVIWMYRYQRVVSGFIYRKFMRALSYGVILIISASIMLQALLSLGPQRLTSAGLGWVLAFLYLFLVIQLAGYLLVSRGAKKLTLIETS